ncbi:MAG: DnaJ domain-containing protein [Dehalococcoidia bacterium]
MADLYKTLQVRPGADDEAIAAAYVRLSRRYDPAHGGPFADESALREVERAYQVLGDPTARRAYDESRDPRLTKGHKALLEATSRGEDAYAVEDEPPGLARGPFRAEAPPVDETAMAADPFRPAARDAADFGSAPFPAPPAVEDVNDESVPVAAAEPAEPAPARASDPFRPEPTAGADPAEAVVAGENQPLASEPAANQASGAPLREAATAWPEPAAVSAGASDPFRPVVSEGSVPEQDLEYDLGEVGAAGLAAEAGPEPERGGPFGAAAPSTAESQPVAEITKTAEIVPPTAEERRAARQSILPMGPPGEPFEAVVGPPPNLASSRRRPTIDEEPPLAGVDKAEEEGPVVAASAGTEYRQSRFASWRDVGLVAAVSFALVFIGAGLAFYGVYQALGDSDDNNPQEAPAVTDEGSPETTPSSEATATATAPAQGQPPAAPVVTSAEALGEERVAIARQEIADYDGDAGVDYELYDLVATTTAAGDVFYAAIATQTGGGGAGQRVFFFLNDEFLGLDWGRPVVSIDTFASIEGVIRVVYRSYAAGDEPCCPSLESFAVVYSHNGSFAADNPSPPDTIFLP